LETLKNVSFSPEEEAKINTILARF